MTLKIFFVSILLAAVLFILITILDMILGINFSHLFATLKKPYQVPEASEYAVVLSILTFFIAKIIFDYLKKKNKKNPSSNEN